jgi:hypothetical protein
VTPSTMPPVLEVRGSRPQRRRGLGLGAAGLAAVAVILGALFAAGVIGGPSYPHAWCGPLLGELHANSGTEQSFEAALNQIKNQDHAPVGQLLSDLYTYEQADVGVESGTQPGQGGDQPRQPVCGMRDGERGDLLTERDRAPTPYGSRQPQSIPAKQRFRQRKRRLTTGRSLTGAQRRILLLPGHSPRRAGGGGITVTVFRRPSPLALAESLQGASSLRP